MWTWRDLAVSVRDDALCQLVDFLAFHAWEILPHDCGYGFWAKIVDGIV
jgi:hypothetical protein